MVPNYTAGVSISSSRGVVATPLGRRVTYKGSGRRGSTFLYRLISSVGQEWVVGITPEYPSYPTVLGLGFLGLGIELGLGLELWLGLGIR